MKFHHEATEAIDRRIKARREEIGKDRVVTGILFFPLTLPSCDFSHMETRWLGRYQIKQHCYNDSLDGFGRNPKWANKSWGD